MLPERGPCGASLQVPVAWSGPRGTAARCNSDATESAPVGPGISGTEGTREVWGRCRGPAPARGWLGGDSDVSVVIRGGPTGKRVLWIFADSLIGRYDGKTRARVGAGSEMPCSSVALVDCGPETLVHLQGGFRRVDLEGRPWGCP